MLVLLVLVGCLAAGLYMHLRVLARWLTEVQEEKAALRASLLEMEGQLTALSKLEAVTDAEAYAARVLMAGRATADSVRLSADTLLSEARAEAKAIVHTAHLKAQNIAVQAYAARELAEQFERAARTNQSSLESKGEASDPGALRGSGSDTFRSDGLDATGVRISPGCDLSTYELKFGKRV